MDYGINPPVIQKSKKEIQIEELNLRKKTCWKMIQIYIENVDAHGCQDMAVEIQALDRAIKELEKV